MGRSGEGPAGPGTRYVASALRSQNAQLWDSVALCFKDRLENVFNGAAVDCRFLPDLEPLLQPADASLEAAAARVLKRLVPDAPPASEKERANHFLEKMISSRSLRVRKAAADLILYTCIRDSARGDFLFPVVLRAAGRESDSAVYLAMLDAAAHNSNEILDLIAQCVPSARLLCILRVDPETETLVWKHRAEIQSRLDLWLRQRDAKGVDRPR